MAARLGRGVITVVTDKALLIELDDIGDPIWIPRSVIHDDSEVWDDEHDEGEVIVRSRWAEKEQSV